LEQSDKANTTLKEKARSSGPFGYGSFAQRLSDLEAWRNWQRRGGEAMVDSCPRDASILAISLERRSRRSSRVSTHGERIVTITGAGGLRPGLGGC